MSEESQLLNWLDLGAAVLCSVVSDSATPWTLVPQAPLSMGFSRQKSWSRSLFPAPGDVPDPGIQTACLTPPSKP